MSEQWLPSASDMEDRQGPMTGELLEENAALRAKVEALERENNILKVKTNNSLANNLCPDCRDKQAGKPCLACTAHTLAQTLATLTAERDRLKEALRGTTASLVAALALIERIGSTAKRAAPSNTMFDQMLRDYKNTVNVARAALRGEGG